MLTKAQEQYFQESKARGENGELLVVYHGSKSKDFDTFQYDPARQTGTDYGEAYYFTTDYDKAKAYTYDSAKDPRIVEWKEKKQALIDKYIETNDHSYVDQMYNLKIDGKNLNEILDAGDYDTGGEVVSAYLDLKNPLVVDAHGKDYYRVYPEFFKEARDRNCDGLIVRNVNDNPRGTPKKIDVYITFKPNQIKAVDNLYPTKSPNFRDNSREYIRDVVKRWPEECCREEHKESIKETPKKRINRTWERDDR